MAFKDLREFIAELESRGLLKRIRTEVDCELEITEITDRVSKMEGEKNVALLFENVKGYDMPVLMNAFGSMERMAIAFGVEKLDDIADELREILRLPYISVPSSFHLNQTYWQNSTKATSPAHITPITSRAAFSAPHV